MSANIKGTQSITKAAVLLRALSTYAAHGASLGDISRLANMPKSSTHRILAALVEEQLVERLPGSHNYRLGSDIHAFGISLQESFDLKPLARPILRNLATELNVASYLGLRSGYDVLCLDRYLAPGHAQPLVMQVNDRWPLGVGSLGLSVLAFLPVLEQSRVIAFNQRRPGILNAFSDTHIQRSVNQTRLRGYAKRTMHSAERLTGVAVPVSDRRNYPVASVCVVLPTGQLDAQRLIAVVSGLHEAASDLSRTYESGALRPVPSQSWRHAMRHSYRMPLR